MKCDRFEREALPRLEKELSLDEHFTTCPDCRKARAAYERLATEISASGAAIEPSAGWERRVWALLEERRSVPRRRPWIWLMAPAAVAAVLAVLVLRPPAPDAPALDVRVESGGSVQRGAAAQPGDRLLLEASTGGARHAELRVYRNDRELVLRCADVAPCVLSGDTLRASLTFEKLGTYQSVLLVSEDLLPAAAARGLDPDSAAALAVGATVELGSEIEVR